MTDWMVFSLTPSVRHPDSLQRLARTPPAPAWSWSQSPISLSLLTLRAGLLCSDVRSVGRSLTVCLSPYGWLEAGLL